MRDRLIELIKAAKTKESFDTIFADIDTLIDMPHGEEYLADYLLANGVILKLCSIGDVVYQADAERIYELNIFETYLNRNKVIYETESIDFDNDAIGKGVFLTKEEAEEKLKELSENG